MAKITVVGAGMGGMGAAALLARDGHDVTVLEQNAGAGGRVDEIRGGGFRFDAGPTLVLLPSLLRAFFRAVGRRLDDYVKLARVAPAYRLAFDDGTALERWPSEDKTRAEIARLNPADAENLAAFLRDGRTAWREARGRFIERNASWRDALDPRALAAFVRLASLDTVETHAAKYFRDARVRAAFTFQAIYLGASPLRAPSAYGTLPVVEMDEGVWHPLGGVAQLARAVERVCREEGVGFRFHTRVKQIRVRDARAAGVETNRGFFAADAVVCNADAPSAYRHLIEPRARPGFSDAKIERLTPSCSAFLLYLGSRKRFDAPHHQFRLPVDFARTLREVFDEGALPENPGVYACHPTATDPAAAPKGRDVVYALAPVPSLRGRVDWARERAGFRKKVLDVLEGELGFRGLEKNIAFERVRVPRDFERAYGAWLGQAFGLAPTLAQTGWFRPSNQSSDVRNLFFVGASTHPGTGVPLVLTGARLAAERVRAELREE